MRVDLTLSPGEQTQTVTVTAEAAAIDTTNATLGGTVTNQAVVLAADGDPQVPGIAPIAPRRSGRAGRQWHGHHHQWPARGSGRYIGRRRNSIRLGDQQRPDQRSPTRAARWKCCLLDSVQEFSTQQNPPAEYGWRDGSAVNLAVKSGTNAIHGIGLCLRPRCGGDGRQAVLAAPGPGSVGNTTMEQPGFTLGGPILKNKLFFFVRRVYPVDQFSPGPVTRPLGSGLAGGSLEHGGRMCRGGKSEVNPLSAQISGLRPRRALAYRNRLPRPLRTCSPTIQTPHATYPPIL